MPNIWKTSLTGRVVIVLGCGMTVIWLLFESIGVWRLYARIRTEIRNDIVSTVKVLVESKNRRYDHAQRQAGGLLRLWVQLHGRTDLQVESDSPRNSIFVPFGHAEIDVSLVKHAQDIIEIYGDADPRSRTGTFFLLPDQGFVFYQPDSIRKTDTQYRSSIMSVLNNSEATEGFFWHSGFTDERGDTYIAVTAGDAGTEVVAGQALLVGDLGLDLDFITRDAGSDLTLILPDESSEILWNDVQRSVTWFSDTDQFGRLFPCGQTPPIDTPQRLVVCEELRGPPWQLVAVYPERGVSNKLFAILRIRAPQALFAQLMMLAVMVVILERHLERPLRRMMVVTDMQKTYDPDYRLPEGRQDELGRFAKAYNRLLEMVNACYETVEIKVWERTRELDKAKCIAEQASQKKSAHISSVSHEIRTPLTGIVGALNLLEASSLSAEQQHLIDTAHQASGHLLGVVNDLLDMASIEAGTLELSFEQTAILPMLDQAWASTNPGKAQAHLELLTQVGAEVPAHALLDGLRVRQILINLLGNAIKFTRQGRVHLLVARKDDALTITVEDTGTGIPDEYHAEIFKPFFQADEHEGGNGLGLALASRLANLMGGEILFTSRMNVGSRFTLHLPLRDASGPLAPLSGRLVAPPVLHPQLRAWGMQPDAGNHPLLDMPDLAWLPARLRRQISIAVCGEVPQEPAPKIALCPWSLSVLVVDDVAANREIIEKMLHALGHETELASSGGDALTLGCQKVFDLVLMDIRMPGMNGLEAARLWRDPAAGMLDPDTPVVALTAIAELPDGGGSGSVDGHLVKPVRLEQLARLIDHAVSMQISRGIDLAPSRALQKPVLDLDDRETVDKVYATLATLHAGIEVLQRSKKRKRLLEMLHAFKGCAGQAGLDHVYDAADRQERRVMSGGWPGREDVDDIKRLIRPSDRRRLMNA